MSTPLMPQGVEHSTCNHDIHIHQHCESHAALVQAITSGFQALIDVLKEGIHTMSVELDALTAQVATNRTVAQSAITLINGLAQQILDHVNDPAALTALANDMKATDDAMATAIAANTPATP